MTTKKKIFVAIASLAASVAIVMVSVFATVAYLTSSAAVSNVFTIGNVSMTMDESKVNPDGTYVTDKTNRTDTNTYKLVPNTKYVKDPIIHLVEGSEPSYLFVLVRNDLEAIEINSDNVNEMTIAEQMAQNGWVAYTKASTGTVYLYYGKVAAGELNTESKNIAVGGATKQDIPLFDYFMVAPNANVGAYGAAKITLTAVAIQTSGFGTVGTKGAVDAAWAAVVSTYPYIHTNSGNSSSGN